MAGYHCSAPKPWIAGKLYLKTIQFAGSRSSLSPEAGLELLQGYLAGFGVLGLVDRLERRHDALSVLPGYKLERVADEVHDAYVDGLLRARFRSVA